MATKAELEEQVAALEAQVAELESDLDAAETAPGEYMEHFNARLTAERDKATLLLREYAGDVETDRASGDFGGRVRAFLDGFKE